VLLFCPIGGEVLYAEKMPTQDWSLLLLKRLIAPIKVLTGSKNIGARFCLAQCLHSLQNFLFMLSIETKQMVGGRNWGDPLSVSIFPFLSYLHIALGDS
jgi:hypothetical protein